MNIIERAKRQLQMADLKPRIDYAKRYADWSVEHDPEFKNPATKRRYMDALIDGMQPPFDWDAHYAELAKQPKRPSGGGGVGRGRGGDDCDLAIGAVGLGALMAVGLMGG